MEKKALKMTSQLVIFRALFFPSLNFFPINQLIKNSGLTCICFQIRSDTSLCVDKTVPGIQEKCESMQQIFERIDKLEVSDTAYVQLSKNFEHKIVIIFLPTNLNMCIVCSK